MQNISNPDHIPPAAPCLFVIFGAGGDLAAQSVSQIIATYQQRYGRKVYFVDRNGQIMLQGKDAKPALPLRRQPGLRQLATKILTSPGGSYTYQVNGTQVYLNSRMIPEFNWYLVVEQIGDPSETRLLNTLLINLLISLLITAIVIVLAYLTLGRHQNKLEKMATYDKLTGAVNREVFETLLRKSLHDAARSGEAFSLIMLDLDHFKRINDSHGHLVGDKVLARTADLVQQRIRESDTLCRWGGEEFLLALPHCEHVAASKLAEELRQALAQTQHFPDAPDIDLSASFDVAGFSGRESATSLIGRADRYMYSAKKNGRNQVASSENQTDSHTGMSDDATALSL